MNNFPLKQISIQIWKKKVDCTSMYTIPAEDDALPVLQQLDEILTRLLTLPLQQTIHESHVEYFFTNVFPPVCQKIIRSRYFKNPQVLKLSNSILQKSVYLTAQHMELAIKFPKFLEVLTFVFSDQYYFKTNNQMTHMIYPYSYFPQLGNKIAEFKVGDIVDILKTGTLYQKVSWSQGQIVQVDDFEVQVAYLFDGMDKKIRLKKDSPQLAPLKTKSHTFQWRKTLKPGDLVDVEDSFGTWYNGTIVQIIDREGGKKNVKVTLKVYHQMGNKTDQNGLSYYGFSDYEQVIDFTSPKLAPFCTISKQFCYQSNKVSSYDSVQDINDYEFLQVNGVKIYALPRKKNLSQFQFQTINGFGQIGGFDKYIQYLQKQVNFDVFSYFIKGISGVAPYLHRKVIKDTTQKLKILFQKYFFNQQAGKQYTKQQSEMAFSGLKVLQKRIYSSDNVSKFENSLKMRLAEVCLQSEAIKNKLQGLTQLKDIVRSVTYSSQKNRYIKDWVKSNKIFQKIYITNSHVQLIKKSQQFFKYLITQNILQVNDLQRLYKIAQKGDFESRVSLYKLFQQVSHIFKKDHVDYLIDTILESDVNLILNQDIDLLHELSRFSNYFPLEKVINFFESLILGDNKVKQINDYAIKKYSQIVAKNQDVKKIRNSIIKKFLQKLTTHDILQITKVLKGIFEGIGTGQWGKKDLNQILTEQKFDQVLVDALKTFKQKPQFGKNLTVILDFLLFIYKISYRTKINIKTLVNIWTQIQGDQEKQKQFYRWANQVLKCEQGFENATSQQLEQFYRKIFTTDKLPDMQGSQMQLAKNFFVQINKKAKYITVSNSFKDRQIQKQYKRKVEMKNLKLIDVLIEMVYQVKSELINNQILNFFIELYTSKDNSQQQIDQLLSKLLKDFKDQYEAKNYKMLSQTIRLLQVVINDSQKNVETNIKSLLSKKQPDYAKFIIINEVSYVSSDNYKKIDMIFPMNMPVIKLRKVMAKQFNLNWQQVKIVSHKQIQDYDNSRTLKQIKLNPNQPLTISRRIVFSSSQQQLILNDQMNPKAIRCFKIIFEKYSTNQRMDKNQCNSFTAMCLGSSCSAKYYNEKITSLYNKYDDDNDGLLTFENFLKFYEDAAKDRPSTVMSNLKSFGVRGDFKFNNEPEDDVEVTKFPRNVIAQQPKVYDMLFDLLHVKSVASAAFQLLQRLPVSKAIQQQLLNIESAQDLSKNLSTHDLYELFYKLNIIEYLAHSNDLQTQAQKSWHSKFISFDGYEQLYDCLNKIVANQSKLSEGSNNSQELCDIIREISETSLNLLNQYWIECFSRDPTKVRLSLTFISADEDIDDKMDYLVFGRFFKSQRKLQPKPSKMPKEDKLYLWKGKPKTQVSNFITKQLSQRWNEICNISKSSESNQKIYNVTMLINKLIDSVNILFMNEDPNKIIHQISNLLDTIPSTDLIKRLYCLILSQCFYVTEGKYQGVYIRQLFKNLTKGSITSEHFRVLAVLVSRFGIMQTGAEGDQSEESTQKLKEVLLDNVLNNNNELTVEGCAKLLTNFYLQNTPYEVFQKIWDSRLFNPNTICQKQQSKAALFELILKLCDNNPQLVNQIIKKVLGTLEQQIKNMKIVYCSEYKQRSPTGYAGLKNLGSTCYINSMIQQLFMNKTFRYCILRADDGAKENAIQVIGNKDEIRTVDDNLLHQLQRIFAYLEESNRIDFAPKDFCIAYKPFGQSVNVLIQQDVQEFVSMFFDRLQAGLSKTLFKKLVQDFYSGKTTNLFECHTCQKAKKVQQNFHCISLQVKTSKTLAESFNRFGLGQMISDYKCDFCDKKVDVTKKTRISKAPKILIIHLQRIVFNYDTFINQKITTKHTFPHNFNLYESTLQYLENKDKGNATDQLPKQYQYSLIGIICHSGTAESGHYISYIKTSQNKWIEFNDSQVTPFNASNIQSQCFGGYYSSNTFDDDYFEEKKQSSKSAYLLIYEKHGANTVQLVLNTQLQACKTQKQRKKVKEQMLKVLDFKEVINKVSKKVQKEQTMKSENEKVSQNQNTDIATQNVSQSHQQSSSAPEDSEKETKQLLEQKQMEIRRHQSEDNIETEIKEQVPPVQQQQTEAPTDKKQQPKDQIVYIQDPLTPYMPLLLRQQITKDNQIHYFQKCLSSTAFAKFFSQLISKPNNLYDSILPVCQKLTFGFWLKSQGFKDLLSMLDGILKVYPAGFESVVTNNPAIINLLIQSSDAQIRTSMANFLAKVIADTISAKNINIYDNPDDPIFKFLDKLLSLLPSTVSKCWTKFGQYFQFWYELSNKGQILVEYMSNRQIIKHFMDYFLDTKSPLKIYSVKRQHPIGSSYANPNFSMLLKCVFSLLQQRMVYNQKNRQSNKLLTSSPEQQILLMSFESLQKLISQNYQNVAAQLVKQICPNNLAASEKAAIVLLKGISKSNSQTIQPYLQVVHQFALIDDEYQDLRIKWVIGKQTLAISPQSQKIVALHAYSIDQRLHNYDSSIFVESGSSLLQPILAYCKRIQTFAMLLTKQLLKLCDESKKIRQYVFSLESPTLTTTKYVDFFKTFIDKYYDDHKKSYGFYSSSPGFNREEFGKYVKQLYEKVIKKIEQDQTQEKLQQSKKQTQDRNVELSQKYSENKDQQEKNKQTQQKNKNNKQAQQVTKGGQEKKKQNSSNTQQQNIKNLINEDQKAKQSDKQLAKNVELYSRHDQIDDEDDWNQTTNGQRHSVQADNFYSEYPNRRKQEKEEYSINVHEEKANKFLGRAEMNDEITYSDQQMEEPLVKTKQNIQQKQVVKDYKQAWHPIKFEYVPIQVLQPNEKLTNLKIEQHQSIVTYVLTKPTGLTNRSFTSISGVHKTSQRMVAQTLNNQRQVKVHGYFVKNAGKDSVRIQTNDGCAFCKSGESIFVWADKIVRVWESQKSIDWPKWRLYTNDNKQTKSQ